MGTHLHLTEQALLTCLESLTTRSSWAYTAAKLGISESVCYQWLHKAKTAERDNDTSSIFYITWRDELAFWNRHCARARRENIVSLEALVRDECRNGQSDYVRDPSTGRRIPQLDAQWLGVSDDAMRDQLLDPVRDRWQWRVDDEGNRIEPLWEVRTTPMPASLRATVLRGLLPATFGEKAEVNHNLRGAVIHHVAPAPYVSRAERAQLESKDAPIDAEFTALPAPEVEARPDIAELRARAAQLLRDGPKHPVAEGVVKDANGAPISARKRTMDDAPDDVPLSKPEMTARDHPRAYDAGPVTQERAAPSYARYPRGTDPTGRMARKIA
jgi:hypothetical protein